MHLSGLRRGAAMARPRREFAPRHRALTMKGRPASSGPTYILGRDRRRSRRSRPWLRRQAAQLNGDTAKPRHSIQGMWACYPQFARHPSLVDGASCSQNARPAVLVGGLDNMPWRPTMPLFGAAGCGKRTCRIKVEVLTVQGKRKRSATFQHRNKIGPVSVSGRNVGSAY